MDLTALSIRIVGLCDNKWMTRPHPTTMYCTVVPISIQELQKQDAQQFTYRNSYPSEQQTHNSSLIGTTPLQNNSQWHGA